MEKSNNFRVTSLDQCIRFRIVVPAHVKFIPMNFRYMILSFVPECGSQCSTLHYITYPTDFFRLVLKTIYLQVRLMYMNSSLSNSTLIWYMHGSSDIDIFTEIRLYDFAAIIAAVGGSLGLFLGFSCLDSILIFFNWIFPQD